MSVFTWGACVHQGLEVAEVLAEEGISVEVVDLRTLVPLDIETVLASVRRTGRAAVLHEDGRRLGYGAEIAAVVAEQCFFDLDAPVARLAALDVPMPFSPPLEDAALPSSDEVVATLRSLTRA